MPNRFLPQTTHLPRQMRTTGSESYPTILVTRRPKKSIWFKSVARRFLLHRPGMSSQSPLRFLKPKNLCPKGYYVKRGTSSSFAAPGDTWVKWPNLCESRKTATITVKTQQIASCGTLHPCHPATGDQSRSEVDFVSAGRPFTRYYHSSGQVWGPSGIGINWSLPYDMRLTNVDRTLIDETGSVETLSHVKSEGVNDYGLSLRRKSLGGTTPPIAFCAGSGIAIMICTMHCSRPTEA